MSASSPDKLEPVCFKFYRLTDTSLLLFNRDYSFFDVNAIIKKYAILKHIPVVPSMHFHFLLSLLPSIAGGADIRYRIDLSKT